MLKVSTHSLRFRQPLGFQTRDPVVPDSHQPQRDSDKQTILDEIVDLMTQDIHNQSGPKKRGQHPKAQGCLFAQFCVDADIHSQLPAGLDVGILREVKTYPSWIRFSNLRQTNDAKGDIHGMAIKLMGVEGPQLGDSDDVTQDFVLIDTPLFFIKGMEAYRDMFRAIASLKTFLRMKQESLDLHHFVSRLSTLGRTIHQFRQFLMPSMRPSQWRFCSVGILGRTLRQKKRHKPSTLLDQQFWSPTPIQWGDRIVKVSVKPWAMNTASKVKFGPDYLMTQLRDRLTVQRKEAVFDVFLQVAKNKIVAEDPMRAGQKTMFEIAPDGSRIEVPEAVAERLINDPTMEWDDAETIKIATLRIPPQVFDDADQKSFSEQLSFSPWHGLIAHEPLGELNQIRREVYQKTADLRTAEQRQTPPESFQPSLLDPAPITEQTALTVFDAIQPERMDDLRQALKRLDNANGFGRSPLTHFARFVIFEDPEIELAPQLLFSSNFDGALEPYLQELLSSLGHELEPIFQCCESYSDKTSFNFESLRRYLLDRTVPAQAFYIACRGVSAQDILKARTLRQTLAHDDVLKSELLGLQALTPEIVASNPAPLKFAKLIPFARWLGRMVWFLIGVEPKENDPSQREEHTACAQERMRICAQSEDPMDAVQNQLSTLSVIKSDFHLVMLRMVLKLVNQVGYFSRGTLSGIGTIHFARWVILEKGCLDDRRAFLFFESNYGDSWDNYLDDFVYLTITAMNSIWANLIHYPRNGCQDIELFKRHSKSRQFPAQVFYRAYPNLTVKNIMGDRKLAQSFGFIGQFIQGHYSVLQDRADHPLINFVKRVNRME